MKKFIKYISIVIVFFISITSIDLPIQAAGASVSVSAGQVYVGDSVTFTVSATGAGYVNISGAVNTSVWLENSSQSFTVSASSPGSLSVSISGVLADFTTEQDVPVSGSAVVQVISRPQEQPVQPETPSQPTPDQTPAQEETTEQESTSEEQKKEEKNNEEKEKQENSSVNLRLASLSVSQGTLSPEFSSDHYTYDVTVDNSVESIEIDASAQENEIEIQGLGKKTLEVGTSTFEIITSSPQTQETSTYTISVHRKEKGQIIKKKEGKKFEVINDEIPALDGFEQTTISIDGKEVNALVSNTKNITLIYCFNEDQEKNFYIYNAEKERIESIYIPVTLFSKNYAVIDLEEELNTGFKEAEIEIDSQVLPGYEFESKDFRNYALLYLMDENGDTNFYQFERSENTLQKYSLAAPITIKRYESLLKRQSMDHKIMIGMLVVDILLVIGLIVLLVLYKRSMS